MENKKNVKKIIVAVIAAAVVIAAALFAFVFRDKIYDRFFAPDVPLTLVSSPSDVVVETGYPAVFEVAAEGNGLSYEWEYTSADGTAGKIKGSVGNKLSLVTDISMNGNIYRCTVTDRNGETVTTDDAVLTVSKEHTYGEMLVTKENTCLNDGEATYVCSSCGAKKTEALPATGHDFDESVSYTGKRLFVCRVCAYSFETDAADKSALDAALDKIPKYVSVYYDGSAAKTLSSIRDKLDTTVYGVKNYDLLSQKETDEYAQRIENALSSLTLKKTDGKNIYITTLSEKSAELSATDGSSAKLENTAAVITDAEEYADTAKKSYFLTLPDGDVLFSSDKNEILMQSCAEDPTLMRTALVYNAADRLGISEAPSYDFAEVWLDGEYLGAYVIRSAPAKAAENAAELKEELIELLSGGKTYDEIKKRVDTARFARFTVLYCALGLHGCVSTDSLLYEENGKISIHLPSFFDGILRPGTQPNFAGELSANDILEPLSRNADFMSEVRYVYALCAERLQNLCSEDDAEEKTDEPTSAEETVTADALGAMSEETTSVSDIGNDNGSDENGAVITSAETADLSSFARLKRNYGEIIERNFTDGAVTYSDSFGRITRYPTFDENARALAEALVARLAAADSYFGE